MKRLYCLAICLLVSLAVPTVAASQPRVPTPTGFLGGRESAGETATVAVVPAPTMTPPGSPAAGDIPGASECLVGPGGPDFDTITNPPARGIASPEDTREGIPSRLLAELPAGTPADDATVAAVTATIRRLIACSNSGNNQSFMALHSDDYFRRAATVDVTEHQPGSFWNRVFGPAESLTMSFGFVIFPGRTPMPELTNVANLPDGRVGAVVRGPGFDPLYVAFARQEPNGPYLVDETIRIRPGLGS